MLARSDNRPAAQGRPALLVLFALLLAACSSSGPSRPVEEAGPAVEVTDVPPVDVEAADAVAPEAPAEPSRRARRRGRSEEAAAEAPTESRRARRRARSDEAAADEAVVAEVPEDVQRAYDSALTQMRSGNWTEAELQLEQFVLEHTSYPGPYVNLAIVYAQDGRYEEAKTALDSALALDPGHAVGNNQLGIILRTEGDFAGAERAYRRAIESDPGYALAYYNLGVLLDLYLYRQAEALEYYEQYQASVAEPDQSVARWIIDLRRRLGVPDATRVAQEDGQ